MKKMLFTIMLVLTSLVLISCGPENVPPTNPEEDGIVVSYETNGGSPIDSVSLDESSLIDAPAFPVKSGYKFAGWYLDEELSRTWDFNHDYITTSTKLYAKWDKVEVDFNQTFKILSIGNSFSEDAHKFLWQIAKSYGINEENIIIANMYIGGAEIEKHVANIKSNAGVYTYQKYTSATKIDIGNYKLEDAIVEEDWDVVTFQQASHDSGLKEKYSDHVNTLVNWALEKVTNDNVLIGWHMTWAYEQTSNHSGFANYDKDQMKMYEAIKSTLHNKVYTTPNMNFVIPSGTAIQNARTSYVGDTLTRDGYHLSEPLGRFIAGLTYFKAITGFEVSSNTITYVPNGMNEAEIKIAFESANNAYLKPLEVTNSVNLNEPPKENVEVNGIPLEYTYVQGFWADNATNVSPETDAIHKNYAAVMPIHVSLLPIGSEIVLEGELKYRVIRLNKTDTGFKVSSRTTSEYKDQYLVVDEELLGDAEYIAFNVSRISGGDISLIIENIMKDFKLYHPEGTEQGHENKPLEFKLGEYDLSTDKVELSNNVLSSNPLNKFYFEENLEISVEAGYQYAIVKLVYEDGEYNIVSISQFNDDKTILDKEFWEDTELIAFMIKTLDNRDLTLEVEETILNFNLGSPIIPHLDESLKFVKGYWNDNATNVKDDDTTANKFIASNIFSREYIETIDSIKISEGYQYRIILLSYNNRGKYQVIKRTENYTDLLLDINNQVFSGNEDWEYMAFNFSASPTIDIENIEEFSKNFEFLFKPIPHVDKPLEFNSGFWGDNTTAPTPGGTEFNNRFITSNVISTNALNEYTTLTIGEGYQVRIVFLTYDGFGTYKVLKRTDNFQGTVNLSEHFLEYEYVAFNISKMDSSQIHENIEEAASQLTFQWKWRKVLVIYYCVYYYPFRF